MLSRYIRKTHHYHLKNIDDEILNEYACVGLHREIVDIVKKKYKNIVTHVEFSIPFERGEDRHLRSMLQELKGD